MNSKNRIAWAPKRGLFSGRVAALFFGLYLACPVAVRGQADAPLSIEQVRTLVSIGAPDATIAREIRARGVAFSVSPDLLAELRRKQAGSLTLAALQTASPPLDQARQQIPHMLTAIYAALDQGDPRAANAYLSPEIANSPQLLDAICKPFTYRAHIVEAVIERPQGRFEVRVRVLFKPLNETAYVLTFSPLEGRFVLTEVQTDTQDWFKPKFDEALEQSRRLVYALQAGRSDVVAQIVDPSFAGAVMPDVRIRNDADGVIRHIGAITLGDGNQLISHKGLKICINLFIYRENAMSILPDMELHFLFEPDSEPLKVVAWRPDNNMVDRPWVESPTLEWATLHRFGIETEKPVPVSVLAPASRNLEPPSSLADVPNSQSGNDPAAIQLLMQVQNAMGGRENLSKVRDWQQKATETWRVDGGTIEVTTRFVAPATLREDSVGGNKTADFSDGTTGWTWSSSSHRTSSLPRATATGMSFRTLNTLLLCDQDTHCKVRLTAPSILEFSDQLRDVAALTVDPDTHLPQKLAWNSNGAMLEETYSDWRTINGISWWFQMSRARDGQAFVETKAKGYRINTGLTAADLSAAP